MVLKTNIVLAAAKRIPLIKFRKGGIASASVGSSSGSTAIGDQATVMQRVSSDGKSSKVIGEAIEDWQLPAKYKRKPIDITEMEYINRGGPA